ncbi:ABC transporter permease [bacterium]|nr:ABC transporter permease [bacterium]
MWGRIFEIVRKEFNQALRDPRMRAILFVPPIVQTIIFGYAINMDITDIKIAWMDMDCTPASRDLYQTFDASPYFQVVCTLSKESEIRHALDQGKAKAVVRVLPGFGSKILKNKPAAVQCLIDGTDSNTASIISRYVNQLIALYIPLSLDLNSGHLRVLHLETETRLWFNPDLKSRDYFVPGVLVNIIALVTIMLTAMAIVREKEIGTMEQLMVTPVRPIELIIGKTLPFAVVGLIDVILITTAAILVFRIPFRGSGIVLLTASSLFLLTTLGTGLFISTISQTQQQALMSTFFFMMPALLLSGFAFPIRNMPVLVQYLTYLNPLRYFIEIVRGVFLKGTGISVLWPQMVALLIFGISVLGMSVLRFHKRLD